MFFQLLKLFSDSGFGPDVVLGVFSDAERIAGREHCVFVIPPD